MSEPTDSLDEFLSMAFVAGVAEPEYEFDAAKPEPVPSEVMESILKATREESSRLLARCMQRAAQRMGWSSDDLAYEAVGEEREAGHFLAKGGDPRRLLPVSWARLLWRARLTPSLWKGLLRQAVASYVVIHLPAEGDVVWGRTTGLSGDERADELSRLPGTEPIRDPKRAKSVASEFVEEVFEEWTNLRTKAGEDQFPNG